MLIGALGHGTYSVVLGGAHILVDPLLTTTFLCGTSEPFPRRVIDLDRMPPVDCIFLTHNHPGHLEPESLDLLPRTIPVFAPADPTISLVLGKLGFTEAHVVRTGLEVSIGTGSIRFLGGDGYASAIFDDDGRFWYLGDRGDFTSPSVVDATVAERPVDVALVSHPSDLHSYLQHSTWDGGAQDRETHEAWLGRSLQTALAIRAGLTVPGSTSNRYLGQASWLNTFVFPMRPDEFATQITRLDPSLASSVVAPGDAVIVGRGGEVRIEHDALPYVRRLPASDDRGLDPTAPVPPVVDRNPENVPRDMLERRCEEYIVGRLAQWAAECAGPYAGELRRMHRHGHGYRVAVVFDDNSTVLWRLFLRDGKVDVARIAMNSPADYGDHTLRIPASTLDRWSRNVVPYFEAGLECRRAGRAYVVGRQSDGVIVTQPAHFRDLVTLHLTSSTDRHHAWLIRTYWPDDA